MKDIAKFDMDKVASKLRLNSEYKVANEAYTKIYDPKLGAAISLTAARILREIEK